MWGDHPHAWVPRSCSYGDDCHEDNTDQEHGGLGNCNASGTRDSSERAKVPEQLSRQIRDACERGLDGTAAEQTTAADWV
jgi:hypothetical protein